MKLHPSDHDHQITVPCGSLSFGSAGEQWHLCVECEVMFYLTGSFYLVLP